jgi:hypothetical protein
VFGFIQTKKITKVSQNELKPKSPKNNSEKSRQRNIMRNQRTGFCKPIYLTSELRGKYTTETNTKNFYLKNNKLPLI